MPGWSCGRSESAAVIRQGRPAVNSRTPTLPPAVTRELRDTHFACTSLGIAPRTNVDAPGGTSTSRSTSLSTRASSRAIDPNTCTSRNPCRNARALSSSRCFSTSGCMLAPNPFSGVLLPETNKRGLPGRYSSRCCCGCLGTLALTRYRLFPLRLPQRYDVTIYMVRSARNVGVDDQSGEGQGPPE